MRESKKGKGGAPKSQAFISGRKKPNTQTFSGRWAVDEEKEQDNAGAVLPHPLTNSGYRLVRSGSDTAPVKIIFSGHFKLEIKPSRIARIDLTSL